MVNEQDEHANYSVSGLQGAAFHKYIPALYSF